MVRFLTLALVLLTCIPAVDAATVNFIFSFTNSTGNVAGTVTGEILGLLNNSTCPATHVIIDSYPGAFSPTSFLRRSTPLLFPISS